MPPPRISTPRLAVFKSSLPHSRPAPLRFFSKTRSAWSEWTGRKPDEHVVNRTDEKDVHAKPAHQGMREKDEGDSHSVAISEKGGKDNKKAEEEKPEAPQPVIGMNDERGGKGR